MSENAGPSVGVLHCPSCGGAVPLGAGERVRCPYCSTEVPLPAEYRALRDQARATADAERLYAQLGTPPGILVRILGVDLPFAKLFVFFFPFAFVYLALLAIRLLARLEPLLHVALNEVLAPWQFWTLVGVTVAALLAVPAVLGSYGRRTAKARRILQAALAARPPARAGGPATCRECGAPLAIPTDAYGVCCAYCHADNLVQVPPAWAKRAARGAGKIRHDLRQAAGEERRQRQEVKRVLRRRALLLLLLIPIFASASLLGGLGLSWREAMDPLARALYGNGRPRLDCDVADSQLELLASDCVEGGCNRTLSTALRYRERLIFHGGDFPAGAATVSITLRGLAIGTLARAEVDLARVDLARGGDATLTAPFSGWFRVAFSTRLAGRYPIRLTIGAP
jgi:hypothetical protein